MGDDEWDSGWDNLNHTNSKKKQKYYIIKPFPLIYIKQGTDCRIEQEEKKKKKQTLSLRTISSLEILSEISLTPGG